MTITITDLTRSDFPVIRDWIDPDLFRIFHAPIGDDQLERLLTKSSGGKPTDLGLKAVDADTGQPVGLLHAVLDWSNELAHIGQVLVGRPQWRRLGVGSQLMAAALRVCFQDHGLHRAQLFVDEENQPAVAFYRKWGFKTDGLMRESRKIGDRFLGLYCMSMLRCEYQAATAKATGPMGA